MSSTKAGYTPLGLDSSTDKSKINLKACLSIVFTAISLILGFIFHRQWDRDISQSPIDLPPRLYTFTEHPNLREFDEETLKIWQTLVPQNWWETSMAEWQNEAGQEVTRAIDMVHMIHCLTNIREIFTELTTNQSFHDDYNAEVPESIVRRYHLGHCFDTIRQDIICAADATLEPLGGDYTDPSGFGVEHICRDWRVIWKLAGLQEI